MFQKAHVKKKKQQNKLVFSYSKISSFPGICLFKLNFYWTFMVVQSLSGVRLCNCMDCNTRGFPVFQYLPEFAQTHVHWVCDAIQPSHFLLPPSPPALNLFHHQGLFQWVSYSWHFLHFDQLHSFLLYVLAPGNQQSALSSYEFRFLDSTYKWSKHKWSGTFVFPSLTCFT